MYDLAAGRRRPDLGRRLDRRTPRPGPPTTLTHPASGAKPTQGVKGAGILTPRVWSFNWYGAKAPPGVLNQPQLAARDQQAAVMLPPCPPAIVAHLALPRSSPFARQPASLASGS
jgi:hypothetical protein